MSVIAIAKLAEHFYFARFSLLRVEISNTQAYGSRL